jgi:hypothetical protein
MNACGSDGNTIAICVALQHAHDLLGRRVWERDDLADRSAFRLVERGDDAV